MRRQASRVTSRCPSRHLCTAVSCIRRIHTPHPITNITSAGIDATAWHLHRRIVVSAGRRPWQSVHSWQSAATIARPERQNLSELGMTTRFTPGHILAEGGKLPWHRVPMVCERVPPAAPYHVMQEKANHANSGHSCRHRGPSRISTDITLRIMPGAPCPAMPARTTRGLPLAQTRQCLEPRQLNAEHTHVQTSSFAKLQLAYASVSDCWLVVAVTTL